MAKLNFKMLIALPEKGYAWVRIASLLGKNILLPAKFWAHLTFCLRTSSASGSIHRQTVDCVGSICICYDLNANEYFCNRKKVKIKYIVSNCALFQKMFSHKVFKSTKKELFIRNWLGFLIPNLYLIKP